MNEQVKDGERVLVLAPTVRDGEITSALLCKQGLRCVVCPTMEHLAREVRVGAGVVVMSEEAIVHSHVRELVAALEAQPTWSDLPVVILMRGGTVPPPASVTRVLQELRNVTLVERPAPLRSVDSAVQAAMRARRRQYQIRDQIVAIQQAEARANQYQLQLQLALEASELGTFHVDVRAGTVEWNDKCREHFWVERERRIDMALFYGRIHPEDRAPVAKAMETCMRGGEACAMEFRVVSPREEIRWIRATGRTYCDAAGKPLRFDGTTRDVTAHKQAEDERERLLEGERLARMEAERANRIKDEFLSTVSHELRTPLNAILGWTQLLAHGGGDRIDAEMVQEAAAVIDRNARLQAQLIEDLLDMGRIMSGKVRLTMQALAPAALVAGAMESVLPTAQAKGVRLTSDVGDNVGMIQGDPGRLQQVLWNLLSNAIKFTPAGGTITVSVRGVESPAPAVELRVKDTGQGIDPEFVPLMFERFRQADPSTTRSHGGLGLGLAIVKQLVEFHGGTVRAFSAGRDKGAEFVVRLPVMGEAAKSENGEAPVRELVRSRVDLSGIKILLVDDDTDARVALNRLLAECGAQVMAAASGCGALEMLETFMPHVLVSDIGMPVMDGYELIKKVRMSGEAGKKLPAAALTAFVRPEDRRRALEAGYQEHVIKPVDPAALIGVVRRLARGGVENFRI